MGCFDLSLCFLAGLAVCLLQLNGIACKDVKKLIMMNAVSGELVVKGSY